MGDNQDNSRRNQPRQPHNYPALVKFCLEATRNEDRTHPSEFHEMDPERRHFLEQALKALTVDVIEELTKAMETLTSKNASEEDQVKALEVVTNFADDIDTANDFFKVGGFVIIKPCLNSEYSEVRKDMAFLVGELAQNNPFCQKRLLDLDIMPRLIELLSDSSEVATNAFHAISCMIRSYEPALANFIDIGGLECILGLIQQQDQEKIIIKSMFLISSFCKDFPAVRDELIKLDGIERIAATLQPKGEFNQQLEQTLSALVTLTETPSAHVIEKCQNNKIDLKEKLTKIVTMGEGKDECKEQVEYSQAILGRFFK